MKSPDILGLQTTGFFCYTWKKTNVRTEYLCFQVKLPCKRLLLPLILLELLYVDRLMDILALSAILLISGLSCIVHPCLVT